MKYISTRGNAPALRFTEILLGGLAPDGGLYMPEAYPRFSGDDLAAMRGMDYRQLAYAIFSRLADDIPAADLKALVDKTYTPKPGQRIERWDRQRNGLPVRQGQP